MIEVYGGGSVREGTLPRGLADGGRGDAAGAGTPLLCLGETHEAVGGRDHEVAAEQRGVLDRRLQDVAEETPADVFELVVVGAYERHHAGISAGERDDGLLVDDGDRPAGRGRPGDDDKEVLHVNLGGSDVEETNQVTLVIIAKKQRFVKQKRIKSG